MNSSPSPAPRVLARRLWTAFLLATLGLNCAAPAFAVSEPSPLTGEKRSYQYSWAQELQLGAEADQEITQQMGLYESAEVQAYVQAVGQRVLETSTFRDPQTPEMYRNTKFTFRVLDSAVVNAFALPGGYVYVTRGLLSHLDNEAQLAVVLGHEVAHVAARHSSIQARRSMWGQIGVIAGAILGQQVLGERMPDIGSTIMQAGGPAMQTFLLKYSREAENEADTYGLNYASRSGYAVAESARFFNSLQRIAGAEGKSIPNWQSSHPDPGDRANHVRQVAASLPPGADRTGEDELLRHLEGLIIGEDPRQGFAQNGTFYHPALRFQMPLAQGWQFENQPTAVVLAEPNGRAMMGLRMAPGTRGRDAAAQFVNQNKIQVTGSGDTVINGLPASVIVGQVASEEGTVGVWNAFIEMEGKVFSLLGYAPAQVFEQMRPTFEGVAAGFSPLRDARLAQIQPTRLTIVRTDRPAPFASFIPTSLPPSITAESLAIMNQVALDQNVPAGRTIKIPGVQTVALTRDPAPSNASNDRRDRRNRRTRQDSANPGPAQGNYPAQPGYPPATNPGYPIYSPGQSGATSPGTYPPSQPPYYPPASPGQTGYPPAPGYPPGQGYPAGQGYPTQQYPNYPQQYPPQAYPPQTYPPQNTYPPATTYPQFPQPGQTQPNPNQGQPPVFPR